MLKLKIYDAQRKLVFKGKTTKLKIPDDLIIEKSMEWFRDPEPCFIHRSAVMKRLFVELEDELETNGDQNINKEELSDKSIRTLGLYSDFVSIEL